MTISNLLAVHGKLSRLSLSVILSLVQRGETLLICWLIDIETALFYQVFLKHRRQSILYCSLLLVSVRNKFALVIV